MDINPNRNPPDTGLIKVYLLGPMAGLTDHGYGAFEKAAAKLRQAWARCMVLSPRDGAPTQEQIEQAMEDAGVVDFRLTPMYTQLLRRDIQLALMADIAFALPGWRDSQGASFEAFLLETVRTPIRDGAWLLHD